VSFVLVGTFFSVVFLVLFARSMGRGLDHDEHAFVAGAKLMAAQGLIPYRDFHYLHTPNLPLVYAALFRFTDYCLLAARTFSVLCAVLTLGLVFAAAWGAFAKHGGGVRWFMGAGGALLLMSNPLFAFTSGKAWNHDLSTLLCLAAFLALVHGARQERTRRWAFLGGALLGLSIGTRLTFAPAAVPLAFLAARSRRALAARARLRLLWCFSCGAALALLPALGLFLLAPGKFWFDTGGYQPFHTMYWNAIGEERWGTIPGRLFSPQTILGEPGNVVLLLLFCAVVAALGLARARGSGVNLSEVGGVLLLFPFLLLGAFVSRPPWYQYFYAPVPFLVVGILYGLAAPGVEERWRKWGAAAFALAVVALAAAGSGEYRGVRDLAAPSTWVPIVTHRAGVEMEAAVGQRRVLTLAPIFPLEGGAEIYPEFSTGPFMWRLGPFLSPEQRHRMAVVSEAELPALLAARPPAAVLLGFEGELEEPLDVMARRHGARIFEPGGGGRPAWIVSR
jgi:4-amino-4-deoxy-L-arabinose transferase-like glycosyltransferase